MSGNDHAYAESILHSDADPRHSRVFVSYARKDASFVDRLEGALRKSHLDVLIDRTDIHAFEDWWRRIEELITEADTVVFVISLASIESEICKREIAFAASLGKRLAPIVYQRVDMQRIPEELANLNFVFFDDAAHFDQRVGLLVEALTLNIEWVRKHTEFGAAARRWAEAGRPGPRGLLLRPPVLEEAEAWIASRPLSAPPPTETTQSFIAESRRDETRRRRRLTISLGSGLALAIVLGSYAFFQRSIAIERADFAQKQQHRAEESLKVAQIKESLFLAKASREELGKGNVLTALQLALQGLPAEGERPLVPDAVGALIESYSDQRLVRSLAERPESGDQHYGAFDRVAVFSLDGKHAAATSFDGEVLAWDLSSGHETVLAPKGSRIEAVALGSQARAVVVMTSGEVKVMDASTAQLLFTLPDRASGASFSSDGQAVLLTTAAETLIVDAASGRRIVSVATPKEAQGKVQLSRDRARLLWAPDRIYFETFVVLLELQNGRVTLLQGHEGNVISALFDPEGAQVLTTAADKTARLWDARSGQQLMVFRGHSGWVKMASFSPDGMRVLTASDDGTARIWDRQTGREIGLLQSNKAPLLSAIFASEGRYVLTVSSDDTMRLWDASTAIELINYNHHIFELSSAQLSPDGTKILTTQRDQSLKLWEVFGREKAIAFRGHDGRVSSGAFNSSATRLVTTSLDRTARVWDVQSGRVLNTLTGHKAALRDARFSLDDAFIATSSDDGTAKLWDIKGGREPITIRNGVEEAPAIDPIGRRLLLSGSDGVLYLLDLQSGRKLTLAGARSIGGSARTDRRAPALAFSSDAMRLVTILATGDTVVWDAESGKRVCALQREHSDTRSTFVAFTANNSRIISADEKRVYAWNAASCEIEGSFDVGSELLVAIAPDGHHFATVSDRIVHIWQIDTGRSVATFAGHQDSVTNVEFSPDGQLLMTTGNDGTLRLWDRSGQESAVMRWAQGVRADGMKFTPSGERIFVTFDGAEARTIWIGKTIADLMRRARETLPLQMTPDESAKFFLDVRAIEVRQGVQGSKGRSR